jgi:hypothetical protein
MRCRNCHTVMMDTDSHCPGCHSSAERATAAPPEPIGKPPGMALLLPIFGGAIGGALYAGIAAAQASGSSGGSRAFSDTGGSSPIRWIFGLLFLLGGGLLVGRNVAALLPSARFQIANTPTSWPTWRRPRAP